MDFNDIKKAANNGIKQTPIPTISKFDVSTPARNIMTRGSIIHASKENIFEFPVFVSSSVSGNMSEVTATNDLLTQLYAAYIQMAVSIQPIVDIKSFKEGKPFKAFKTDVNQYLEYCDTTYQKDACHASYKLDDKTVMEFNMISIDKSNEEAFCEYALHEPLSEFSHYFQEATNADDIDDDIRKSEREHQNKYYLDDDGVPKGSEDSTIKTPSDAEIKRKRAEESRKEEKHNIDKSVKAGKFIDTSKINKLNSLTPMMMTVSMNVEDKKGNLHRQMEYVVGVKTYCRIVDANVLPEVVEYPIKNMNKLTRKAKWRAGEISFWEYLFKTQAKKQTAIDSRDPRRKWYRRLYELANEKYSTTAGKFKQASDKRNNLAKILVGDNYGLMPNATIILSMQDCYNIKEQVGIDILNPKIACKFCDDMFLMCLMVMDIDNDNLKILTPDTHNDFDIQSLDSIQKQVSMLDPSKAKAFNSLFNK